MTQVKLPDGSIRDLPAGASALDVARDISEGLARTAVAAKVDGVVCDLATTLPDECEVALLTPRDGESMEILRHSAAHILAQAVRRLHGEQVQYCIGPALMDDFQYGFYYDFDLGDAKITDDDLKAIEAEMKKIVKEKLPIAREDLSAADAKAKLAGLGQHYKIEMIDDMSSEEQAAGIALYTQGEFTDMCRGPHLQTTGQLGKGFKLLSVAGAYWRGDEANKMLTRIYGNAFFDKKELAAHLAKLEEAKKRDHRIIGKEMDLFLLDEKVGPGMPMWLPKGAVLRTELEAWLRGLLTKAGYSMVYSPQIGKLDLYRTSGHYPYYKDSQFPPITFEDEGHEDDGFLLRPMNCPHHHKIFASRPRSYRDLPLRFAEYGHCYRYEDSGALSGLLRVRGFTQDDAHLFCRPSQIEEEITKVLDLIVFILQSFGFFEYKIYLSTRPEKYVGADEGWENATKALENALNNKKLDFEVDPGEGVFYGPKIDIKIKDSLNRYWQVSTVQVDFNLPERFDISYIEEDGQRHQPIMLHRALMGSLERFFGCLVEHYAGAFPLWLAPVQVILLTITDNQIEYAEKLAKQFEELDIRVEKDLRNEKIGFKIREAQLQKIPYMVVLGDKEVESQTLGVRKRRSKETRTLDFESFLEELKSGINSRLIETEN